MSSSIPPAWPCLSAALTPRVSTIVTGAVLRQRRAVLGRVPCPVFFPSAESPHTLAQHGRPPNDHTRPFHRSFGRGLQTPETRRGDAQKAGSDIDMIEDVDRAACPGWQVDNWQSSVKPQLWERHGRCKRSSDVHGTETLRNTHAAAQRRPQEPQILALNPVFRERG